MNKLLITLRLSFLLASTIPTGVSAQILPPEQSGWKAGIAREVITPEKPMWMAGYASRDHQGDSALHDLWLKVLVIEDQGGKKVALLTSDLLGFPKEMSDRIRNRLEKRYGLKRDQVILSCSHTHSGPVLEAALSDMYPLDDSELKKVNQYSDRLEDRVIEITGKALKSMQPVRIYAQNGVTRFQVNRRTNTESTLIGQDFLNGPNDFAVPVIKVLNEKGEILAIAFGYACHATVLSFYRWSGDYPGFAQIELEKLYPGATAMFFQGAGADLNPLPRRTVPLAQQYGRELAAAVDRVLKEEMRSLAPVIQTAYSEINLSLQTVPGKEELRKAAESSTGYQKRWAERLLYELSAGDTLITQYPYPVQIWQLGGQTMITLGGELVVEYSIQLKKLFGRDIFVLGYSNDVMAYIPSVRILKEGGYEGESSQKVYGMPAMWSLDIEEKIINEVVRLCGTLGLKQVSSIP